METYKLNITTTLNITEEDIDDIMCTAIEGGITNWCSRAKVAGEYLGEYGHEQIARGGKLLLYDMVEDKEYELTLEDLLKGIKMAIEEGYYENYGWFTGSSLDTGNVDAEVADVIIQFALFEEVVYG